MNTFFHRIKRHIPLILIAVLCGGSLSAQEYAWRDTIPAAVKTDAHRLAASLGRLKTGLEGIRNVVSPLGEGDPVRWAQGLPGVAIGADGTTAMYVRGGNAGNNLFSLDGIPVYGFSHILGLTTIVPTEVIESVELGKGGFDGAEGNFSSAHLRIVSKNPSNVPRWSVAVNNFLASAEAEGPVGEKMSFILSARISPISWEYRAVRNALPDLLSGLDNFHAGVGDIYGKLRWQTTANSHLEASLLGSLDRYGFDTQGASREVMMWHNMIGMIKYCQENKHTRFEATAAMNNFGSRQEQDKTYRGQANHLLLRSGLMEYTLSGNFRHRAGEKLSLSEGICLRYARFTPGQVSESSRKTSSFLANVWMQAEYVIPEHWMLRTMIRGSFFHNNDLLPEDSPISPYRITGVHFEPEASLSVKWNLTSWLALEATYDRMAQFYHLLEGLPVGWSLDILVPSGEKVQPERSRQGNVGLTLKAGCHGFSTGVFYKQMENMIYYKYSQALFSGALAVWERFVEFGNGRSYGLESLYEYQLKDFYARVAYTLSKTTREGFPSFYEGRSFHARFDRRHVLNATVSWRGFSATLILQSGHWENGTAESYTMPFLWESWVADYYSGINNYQMPTVIRLDLGWQKQFRTGRLEHLINLGVCNVTNHFNPFMLYYDTRTESWKELALLPILPCFSYRIVL